MCETAMITPCENLETYIFFASVPEEAKKPIKGGRLKGMTDINPMWRIKVLTERYGPCGFGWRYVITDKRIVEGADGVVCVFMDIDLYVKDKGEWSEAIPGTGGSTLVSKENGGLFTSDECFKMALTDAISVSCKALGIGADVYWAAGRTKYTQHEGEDDGQKSGDQNGKSGDQTGEKQSGEQAGGKQSGDQSGKKSPGCIDARKRLIRALKEKGVDIDQYAIVKGLSAETTEERFEELLKELEAQK